MEHIKYIVNYLIKENISILSLFFDINKFVIDDKNFNQVYDIFKYDPVLTSTIIQNAHSKFSGQKRDKISLDIALNILGTRNIASLVVKNLKTPLYGKTKRKEMYKLICYHSIGTGVFARIIAPYYSLPKDYMCMVGLLHDVGKLILYIFMPLGYERVIEETRESFITIRDAESSYFGFDHCDVGEMTLKSWGYSEEFSNITLYHHDLDKIRDPLLYKQILCIQASNVLCNHCRIGDMKSIRTMRSQLFDKKTKELLKGIKVPLLITEGMKEIQKLLPMFGI